MSLPFLVIPPDLHDCAGFLTCNPERQRLVAQLEAHVDPHRWNAEVDCAADIAKRCKHEERVAVVFGPRDQRAARILEAALRGEGVWCEMIRTRVDGTLEMLPGVSGGAVSELEIEQKSEWLDACRERWREDRSVRVMPMPFSSWPEAARARSPLPRGLGVEDLEWRAALLDLVAELWPRSHARFLAALGAHDLGINLREDVFAGLGLRERNAELLVNIVEGGR